MKASEASNKILERLQRKAGVPGLLDALSERLSPSELTSLMLEVYRRQARKRTPAQVLADYERDRFVRPSRVDVPRLLEWEQVALSSLPDGFELVELAPVCPIGTSSVVAGVDQNWSVATSRNSEVVSDATNVLALEGRIPAASIFARGCSLESGSTFGRTSPVASASVVQWTPSVGAFRVVRGGQRWTGRRREFVRVADHCHAPVHPFEGIACSPWLEPGFACGHQ